MKRLVTVIAVAAAVAASCAANSWSAAPKGATTWSHAQGTTAWSHTAGSSAWSHARGIGVLGATGWSYAKGASVWGLSSWSAGTVPDPYCSRSTAKAGCAAKPRVERGSVERGALAY